MIPLKDALPGNRAWVAVVLALVVLAGGAVRPLVAVLAALVVFIAADGVARRSKPVIAVVVAVVGAAIALALGLAGDADSAWNPLGPQAAAGAAIALAVAHLALAPRARVLSFSLVPAAGGMVAVPAVLWAVVGAVLVVVLR